MRIVNKYPVNADGTIPKYLPGKEPETIQNRIRTLLAKLDEAYPDYVISGLQADHKKWAEAVSALYRELGYDSGDSFLAAYGYTVQRKQGGRPASVNPEEIIEELKKRYPNGASFKSVDELFVYNLDLLDKKKTLANNAQTYWGMSFGEYLIQLGLLRSKNYGGKNLSAEELLSELQKRYPSGTTFTTVGELMKYNLDIAKGISKLGKSLLLEKGFLVKSEKQPRPPQTSKNDLWFLVRLYPSKELAAFTEKRRFGNVGDWVRMVCDDKAECTLGIITETRTVVPENVPIGNRVEIIQEKQFISLLLKKHPIEAGTTLNELYSMFTLSEDGKVLIAYSKAKNPIPNTIAIPQGVERIADDVFEGHTFLHLYLPASLESLGNSLLLYRNKSGEITSRSDIRDIFVAPNSRHFVANDIAFFRIQENGAKETLYSFPNDATIMAENGILHGYEFCTSSIKLGELIAKNGGKVVKRMREQTDFLILNNPDAAAEEKARTLDIRIMPLEVLHSICGTDSR